ncbi:hypothetical protein GPJ56_003123 [Histomonas meleagridis]|uniref:uncharacterized protein n=1 Tax=Histomonas meleagridis TaxID=135588 RepID=UPI00355A8FE4|nr:hypothetical protein GPJ56_003123 [Histomonas meleagridis]KAH0800619.1 hypothetical protein GO595_006372 [Histomonas meleagridis]
MKKTKILLTPANRNISELTRPELESLIIEFHQESIRRSKIIHDLREENKKTGSKMRSVQSSLQDQNLDYLVPPSALRSDYATRYIPTKTEFSSDIATRENGEPALARPISGSYNPYQGSNRRITSLRQKIGDLQQEIIDTETNIHDLSVELEKLRAILENRPFQPPTSTFQHQRKVPKKKKKPQITLQYCIKYCRGLLKQEKDPIAHDILLCAYFLLTKQDLKALELFDRLYQIEFGEYDPNEIDDLLNDRNAQVSILLEQYKSLKSRHDPLRDAFIDLKSRLPKHIYDNSDISNQLQKDINKLKKEIGEIPKIEQEIKDLKDKKAKLNEEKDKIMKDGSNNLSNIEDEYRKKINGISEDKAEVEQEKRQLEEVDKRIRERYNTIAEELERIKNEEIPLRKILDDRDSKKKEMHRKLVMLENAGVKTPQQVREIYAICDKKSPDQMSDERYKLVEEYNKNGRKLKNLKKNCLRLKNMYVDKQKLLRYYQDIIENENNS